MNIDFYDFMDSDLKDTSISASDSRLFQKFDDFELSVRSRNCLKDANIKYIGEIVQKSEEDLLKIRNFGKKSLNEIKQLLHNMGLSLNLKLSIK